MCFSGSRQGYVKQCVYKKKKKSILCIVQDICSAALEIQPFIDAVYFGD